MASMTLMGTWKEARPFPGVSQLLCILGYDEMDTGIWIHPGYDVLQVVEITQARIVESSGVAYRSELIDYFIDWD